MKTKDFLSEISKIVFCIDFILKNFQQLFKNSLSQSLLKVVYFGV